MVKHTLEMHHVSLLTDRAEHLPAVQGDPRQIQQVFLNLINNALAAMPGEGVLNIQSRFRRSDRMVSIAFSDTGPGVAPEHMDRIFEPFFTTKPEGEGTGLGLFVSYGIVAKFGGTLTCSSPATGGTPPAGPAVGDEAAAARGATFTVLLPPSRRERK